MSTELLFLEDPKIKLDALNEVSYFKIFEKEKKEGKDSRTKKEKIEISILLITPTRALSLRVRPETRRTDLLHVGDAVRRICL